MAGTDLPRNADGASPPVDPAVLAEELRNGPRGALLVATLAVLCVLAGWLAFYFLLFIPRGPIG